MHAGQFSALVPFVCVCVCVALISGMCSVFVLYSGFRCTTHVSTAVLTGTQSETE